MIVPVLATRHVTQKDTGKIDRYRTTEPHQKQKSTNHVSISWDMLQK